MKKKLLIVDDEVNIGLLLENFLSEQYEVVYLNNGQDALDWLETTMPDLVICDIEMPAMDGYQFLASLRQRG